MIIRSLRNHYRRIVVWCCLALLMLTLILGAATAYAYYPPSKPGYALFITFYNDSSYTTIVGYVDDYTGCGGGYYASGSSTPWHSYVYEPC